MPSWSRQTHNCAHTRVVTHALVHMCGPTEPTVIPLHLLATQKPLPPTVSGGAPLSFLVQPAPQQRQRNQGAPVMIGRLISSELYSSAPERGGIKYGHAGTAVFVKMSTPTMPCYYPWNNSCIQYGTDSPTRLPSSHLI